MNVLVDAIRIRPVCLHRDCRESFLLNEALRDLSPLPIELVRSVRRLAKQDEARIADEFQQGIVIACWLPSEAVQHLEQDPSR